MIPSDAFVIDMSGARETRHDYRRLPSPVILRLVARYEEERILATTEDDRLDAEFALEELRIVLMERR